MSRQARCASCGNTRDSNPQNMAFFEFRGEGSQAATETCGHCNYHKIAHDKPAVRPHKVCGHFIPKGAWEFDSYYCGCRGWD